MQLCQKMQKLLYNRISSIYIFYVFQVVQVVAGDVECGSPGGVPGVCRHLLTQPDYPNWDGAPQQYFHLLQSYKFDLVGTFRSLWGNINFQSDDKWEKRNIFTEQEQDKHIVNPDRKMGGEFRIRPKLSSVARHSTFGLFSECNDVVCKQNESHRVSRQHNSPRLASEWNNQLCSAVLESDQGGGAQHLGGSRGALGHMQAHRRETAYKEALRCKYDIIKGSV